MDPDLLLAAIDDRRQRLAAIRDRDADAAPLTYVEVAAQVGTHSATFSRLKAGNLPSEKTLGRILVWLGATAEEFETGCTECGDDDTPTLQAAFDEAAAAGGGTVFIDVTFAVTGSTDLPVAPADTPWDQAAAADRVFELFTDEDGTVNETAVGQAFLWRDPEGDPQTPSGWALGYADVIDEALTIVPKGVTTVAAVLEGGESGVPEEDRPAVEERVCALYDVADLEDCPFADDEEDDADDEDEAGATAATGEHASGCGCQRQAAVVPVTAAADTEGSGQTAAIIGTGALSQSEDPETQSALNRVRELLAEGSVGVSIAHDMNPDDMPDPDLLEDLMDQGRWEEVDELLADVRFRPRHVAIVDTPAFADARLTLGEDGLTVSGPVVFEGIWTGDMRSIPFEGLVWDDDLLPIPIIWDRHDGDHTGMTVGSITTLKRVVGETSAARTSEDAVAAAAGSSSALDRIPARFFATRKPTGPEPIHVSAPDPETGLRHIYGTAAPNGVCHRSDMGACFQYPADVDRAHRHFHTGAAVTLDNGESVRVGALTLGGLHLDTGLAQQGVSARETNRHREDANQVFALVRAYADPFGLQITGVVVPGVTEKQLAKALGSAPSVELWPEAHGRTLVGLHLVPTPAWPVAAAAGGAQLLTSTTPVEVDEPEVVTLSAELESFDFEGLDSRLSRIEKALALLVSDRIADGIDLPEVEPSA